MVGMVTGAAIKTCSTRVAKIASCSSSDLSGACAVWRNGDFYMLQRLKGVLVRVGGDNIKRERERRRELCTKEITLIRTLAIPLRSSFTQVEKSQSTVTCAVIDGTI